MKAMLPNTHSLLGKLRRRLRTLAWQQELGLALLAGCVWWLFSYGLDAFLHLPGPVRLGHSLVLVVLPVWFLVHRLTKHWRGIPGPSGLAVLAERGQENNEDLLVTAVELTAKGAGTQPSETQPSGTQSADPKLAEIAKRAETRAQALSLEPVLDERPARRALLGGLAAACVLAATVALTRDTADIFVARMLGADVPWPQKTHLDIEIPGRADRMFVERDGDRIHVRVARGSDLPILVRAEGEIPDQVSLVFSSGHKTILDSGGSELFRTQLRSVQQDVTFYANGGDDNDHRPEVTIEVLDPPDVSALAFRVTPPAYSGLPSTLVRSGDVTVLAQSQVEVLLLPDPLDVQGSVHILPDAQEIELVPTPFPTEGDPELANAGEGETFAAGLGMTWKAEDSVRLRFELRSQRGLLNPDPGLYSIQVREDRRPNVVLLAPGRVDTEVVLGGLLPLRVLAQDDFGLSPMRYTLRTMQAGQDPVLQGELTQASSGTQLPPEFAEGSAGDFTQESSLEMGRVRAMAHRLLEVDSFLADGLAGEGQVFQLQVEVNDNRQPDMQTTKSSLLRVRVVTGDEYLRKLESRLAQAGDAAGKLSQLILRTQTDLSNLQTALQDDPQSLDDISLSYPLFDVGRVEGDARELARDLAALTENLLYARLDPRAEKLLGAMDGFLATQSDRSFDPAPWASLAAGYEKGQYGQADLAGDLLDLVGLSLTLSETHALAMRNALENSAGASSMDALTLAYLEGQKASRTIEELLTRLGEWDNFQSVVTRLRDIIKRQRTVHERTREFAKDQ